jgi:translocator protein
VMRQILGLVGWLAAAFAAAAFGGLFSPGEWYAQLDKPSWNPPGWIFGPVWTALYAMMGVAAWLVWRRSGFAGAPVALALFGAQLVLNAMWSWLFFGLHRPALALVDIVALGLAIAATIVAFWQHSRPAALLLVPYLGWVGFATALNLTLWRLNR